MERTGTPFGILLHGGDLLILQHQVHQSAIRRKTAAALLSSAAVLVANSEWTRDRCLTLLSELDIDAMPDRVRVVPLGADHEFFRPGLDTREVRARYGLGEGRWLLGRPPQPPQGHRYGAAGAGPAPVRYPDLRYAVVGTGEEHEALTAEARELGVADRVRFLTDVPDRDLPAL